MRQRRKWWLPTEQQIVRGFVSGALLMAAGAVVVTVASMPTAVRQHPSPPLPSTTQTIAPSTVEPVPPAFDPFMTEQPGPPSTPGQPTRQVATRPPTAPMRTPAPRPSATAAAPTAKPTKPKPTAPAPTPTPTPTGVLCLPLLPLLCR